MIALVAAAEYGEGTPVAILHGLFGSGRNWTSIAQRLGERHHVIAFDLRNHGASPWAATMDYPEMADDLSAAMQARGHHHYALIGHSMGGKVAMVAALKRSEEVDRLVIVDIAPVAYPIPFLAYIRAMRDLDLGTITRRRDADAQLAKVIANSAERGFLVQNLMFEDGAPRWRLNLAAIETAMPTLAGFPLFPPGTIYRGPTLFVAGGKSRAVLPEYEPSIRSLFPRTDLVRIADAGHWVHAEQPAAFLAAVELFLAG
jgi:esterase